MRRCTQAESGSFWTQASWAEDAHGEVEADSEAGPPGLSAELAGQEEGGDGLAGDH